MNGVREGEIEIRRGEKPTRNIVHEKNKRNRGKKYRQADRQAEREIE